MGDIPYDELEAALERALDEVERLKDAWEAAELRADDGWHEVERLRKLCAAAGDYMCGFVSMGMGYTLMWELRMEGMKAAKHGEDNNA